MNFLALTASLIFLNSAATYAGWAFLPGLSSVWNLLKRYSFTFSVSLVPLPRGFSVKSPAHLAHFTFNFASYFECCYLWLKCKGGKLMAQSRSRQYFLRSSWRLSDASLPLCSPRCIWSWSSSEEVNSKQRPCSGQWNSISSLLSLWLGFCFMARSAVAKKPWFSTSLNTTGPYFSRKSFDPSINLSLLTS